MWGYRVNNWHFSGGVVDMYPKDPTQHRSNKYCTQVLERFAIECLKVAEHSFWYLCFIHLFL